MTTEKQFFTKRRKEQLSAWPHLRETEKWGKHCFVPLDIPKFQNQKLVDWFFENQKEIYKLTPDVASKNYNITNFCGIDVLPTNEPESEHTGIWTLNVQQSFLDIFPEVNEQIMDNFPFRTLTRMRFWSSTRDIFHHRDHTRFVDSPSSFRIMLYDENPEQTLSLIPSLPDQENKYDEKFTIPSIKDSNSFVWNNLRVKHGSSYDQKYRKILLILDGYDLDVQRYNTLLEKSVNKYQQFVMKSDRNLLEYVNL